MKRFTIILLALLLPATAAFSQSNDANISTYSFADTEPYIAVNPTNPDNIITGWMRVTGFTQVSIFTKASFDGGQTWSSGTTMPHLWPSFTSADISIDFSSAGTAYLCYIDYATSQDSGYVLVSPSTDGGLTWSAPVKVISALEQPDFPIDRPWIAVDRSGGPYNGKIYVAAKAADVGALPHHIWMKSSSDGGTTWSPLMQLDDSIALGQMTKSMAVPAVGADGNLYIGYFSYVPSLSIYPRIISLRSTDGGNSFTPYVIANLTASSAFTDTLYQFSYAMSANPTNSSNLVFTWTDARYGDVDILASVSNDEGMTWSTTPIRINDDAQGNGIGQDMSWSGFSPNGIFATAWRDRRNGGITSSDPFEVYIALSLNGGASFTANYKLSTAQSPVITITRGNDFLGLGLSNNDVFCDWSDLRSGNTEIFFRREPLINIIGINDESKPVKALTCFPNPVSNELTVQFEIEKEQQVKITLCDLQGRELEQVTNKKMSKGKQNISFSTDGLAAGTYICRVECAEGVSQVSVEKVK